MELELSRFCFDVVLPNNYAGKFIVKATVTVVSPIFEQKTLDD